MHVRKQHLNPLYSLSDAVNDKNIFDFVEFDDKLRALIKVAIDKKKLPAMFAVAVFIPRDHTVKSEGKVIPLQARARPSLSTGATEKDIVEYKESFQEDFIVARPSVGSGIVHTQLIEMMEQSEADENKEITSDAVNKKFKIMALSFSLAESREGCELYWINRSSQNRTLFKRDELALACLMYQDTDVTPVKTIMKPISDENTMQYHLNRSIPQEIFLKFLKAAEKNLGYPCKYLSKGIIGSCYSFSEEKKWEDIRESKPEKARAEIKSLLETNMYIASSLPRDPKLTSTWINGHENNLRLILRVAREYGIDLDLNFVPLQFRRETDNATALSMAIKRGNQTVARILLKQLKTHTPSLSTQASNFHRERILNAQDNYRSTPLMTALKCKHPDLKLIKLLIANRPDFELHDIQGNTALLIAIKSSNKHIVGLLLQNKDKNSKKPLVNLEAMDAQGNTALLVAARAGEFDIAKMLIARGAAKDHQNRRNDDLPYCLAMGILISVTVEEESKDAENALDPITVIKEFAILFSDIISENPRMLNMVYIERAKNKVISILSYLAEKLEDALIKEDFEEVKKILTGLPKLPACVALPLLINHKPKNFGEENFLSIIAVKLEDLLVNENDFEKAKKIISGLPQVILPLLIKLKPRNSEEETLLSLIAEKSENVLYVVAETLLSEPELPVSVLNPLMKLKLKKFGGKTFLEYAIKARLMGQEDEFAARPSSPRRGTTGGMFVSPLSPSTPKKSQTVQEFPIMSPRGKPGSPTGTNK